jgi:hypothetical protein
MTTKAITLKPNAIACCLGAAALVLVVLSVLGQLSTHLLGHDSVYGFVPAFNLDSERNVPTFFSSLLLISAAFLLTTITILERRRADKFPIYWAVLAFGFLLMSADEAVSIHESFDEPLRIFFGSDRLGYFVSVPWAIPGIAVVLALGLFFIRFLLRIPEKTAIAFTAAGFLYVLGSIGFELVGGVVFKLRGSRDLMYNMVATVEESLEMAGVILFLWALMSYLADNYGEIVFRFGPTSENSRPASPNA